MKIKWWRGASESAVGWDSRIRCPRTGGSIEPESCLACGQNCQVGATVSGRRWDKPGDIETDPMRCATES